MEWGAQLLVLALAVGFGFVGGRLALLGDRRRTQGNRSQSAAEFRLEHVEDQTWTLVNIGQGTASLVSVLPVASGLEHWPPRPGPPDHVETVASELLPTLCPGGSTSVWFSRYDPGQRVIVSWTSESNVRMGPVMLDLPAPG